MKKLFFLLIVSQFLHAEDDTLAVTRAFKTDFQSALLVAEKTATLDTFTTLWKASFAYMNSIPPTEARSQVIVPLAKLVKGEVKKRAPLMRNMIKPFLPVNAGMLMAVFLEADLPEDALLTLFALTKADSLFWAYPDTLLITALSQLLLTITVSEEYLMPIMIIIEEEPFTFFKATGAWGSVVHLLVDLVIGKTDQDLPPFLMTSMELLVTNMVRLVKVSYPKLLSVRNSDNQTAFEFASARAHKIRAKKPHCAKLLDLMTTKS